MQIAALVVSIVAALLALFAILGTRQKASEANLSARRSASAAERSAEAAERAAASVEQRVDVTRPPDIAFRVEHTRNALYLLRNIGTKPATGVSIAPFAAGAELPEDVVLESNEAIDFFAAGSMHDPLPSSIAVTCTELSEAVQVAMPPT